MTKIIIFGHLIVTIVAKFNQILLWITMHNVYTIKKSMTIVMEFNVLVIKIKGN
jgi:hypothetical protein